MLQSIRDRTHGWIAGIIISLIILSFALWGIHSYFMGGAVNTVVAEVNGVDITKGQLAVAYERLRRQLQIQLNSNDINAGMESGLKDRALQALINIQVLKQASVKQNYFVSTAQVEGYLESMPEFQVDGQFSLSRFQQALSTTMYTPVEFLELIKTSLLIDQPRLGTIFSSFSLPNEVDDIISLVNQERDIDYVVFPYEYFAKQTVNISPEMVKKYYDQHQDEFKTPEQVSIEFIDLSVKDLMNKINPTDVELTNFFNENTNAFADPIKWQIETLTFPLNDTASEQQISDAKRMSDESYEKAKEGMTLMAIAKRYSLPSSSVTGPKWVTQNELPFDLQKSIATLTKSGEIGAPVKTPAGYVIVKVIEFKEAQPNTFEKVKDKVKELYAHQKAQELFAQARENLANLTYQHPESLEIAAKDMGLSIRTTGLFTVDKGTDEVTSNKKIREAAYSQEVLTLQNNSDVIQRNSDSATVVRVKSHIPSSMLSLNVVQQQIMDKLKVAEINKRALQEMNEIAQKLSSGSNGADLLKPYNVNWKQVGFVERHSTKVDSAILDTAFEMPKPVGPKLTYSVTKVPNGYAIVGLKAVREGQLNATDQYNVYAEQAQNAQGLLEYGLYKLSATNEAKIVNK